MAGRKAKGHLVADRHSGGGGSWPVAVISRPVGD